MPDHKTRAGGLQKRFWYFEASKKLPLWRTIYKAHRKTFWWEWSVAGVQSVMIYAPQLCLYKTLTLLEKQQVSGINSVQLWLWVVGIGISHLLNQILKAQ